MEVFASLTDRNWCFPLCSVWRNYPAQLHKPFGNKIPWYEKLPMLLPFQVLMVPDYLVLDRLGLMDTVWSIILPGAVSTFPVFIMKKGFDGIPVSVLEAAELDGAGAITTYIRIGLPLGIPGILSALLLSFIEAWNAIEQPLVFLKSQNLWPMSLFLANITQDDIGIAMVASVFMLLPVILIFLFGQRYLILGIQSSGVKE